MSLRSNLLTPSQGRARLHAPDRAVASVRASKTLTAKSCQYAAPEVADQENRRISDRRSLLLASGAALVLAPLKSAIASEAEAAPVATAPPTVVTSITYQDPQDGFTVTVPPGWAFGEGTLEGNSSFSGASGERRTLAWFPEGANARDVNVSLVITNVSVEFTKLGSFGTPYTFASTLVNSQDRSYLLRGPEWARGKEPIQIAKLVDAKEISNKYFVEYTIQKLPEPQRHLYSLLALGYNGRYNRLYTITAQTLEADRPKYESTLLAMVNSLKVPAQAL